MSTISGYSNNKQRGTSKFVTPISAGSDKVGLPSPQMMLYELAPAPITVSSVALSSDSKSLEVTFSGNHLAATGDVLRIITGNLKGWEFEVISVSSATVLSVHNIGELNGSVELIAASNTAMTLRWVTALADSTGNVQVTTSAAPIEILVDGVATAIEINTVTPANTVPMPVEIIGTAGPINITAGDLNVQLSDQGVNYDITRIGDGTNQLGINSSSEVLVNAAQLPSVLGISADATSLSVTQSTEDRLNTVAIKNAVEAVDDTVATDGSAIVAKGLAIGGTDGTNFQILSVDSTGALNTVTALPEGIAADANSLSVTQSTEDRIITNLMLTSLQLLDDTVATDGAAIVTKGLAIGGTDGGNFQTLSVDSSGKLNVIVPVGILADAASLSVTQSTEDRLNTVAIKNAVEKLDNSANTDGSTVTTEGLAIGGTDGTNFQLLSVDSSGKLNVITPVGIQADTASLSVTQSTEDRAITNSTINTPASAISAKGIIVGGSDGTNYRNLSVDSSGKLNVAGSITATEAALTATYQEILNLTTAMQTFTAPAGSKWALVNTDEANTSNVRVKFGGSATATSGIQFQPGRSETFNLSGNITVFAESGTNQKVYVQFGNT